MAKERKPETADTEPIIEVYGSHFELIYKTALLNKVELNTTKQINELAVWLQDVAVGLNQISEHGWKVHEIEYYVAKAKKETAEAEYLAWRTTNSTAENNETFESFVMWWNNKNTPQPIVKQKPELNGKLITFKNSETIDKIHSELKGYFPNKEAELLKALQGEQLGEILLFPHNQNKFVEVFRRLKYNGFLLNTDTETKNWICTTFQFVKKGFPEPQPFNENTVWNCLNKGKGEPAKKERICITDWLPYKSPKQLEEAAQKEKL